MSSVSIETPVRKTDFATVIGLLAALLLIVFAILLGNGNANFFNGPALLIVVFGTIAATSVSFTVEELHLIPRMVKSTFTRQDHSLSQTANKLIEMAMMARQKGLLSLGEVQGVYENDPFLARALQMVVDGMTPEDIERLLGKEIDTQIEQYRRSAGIIRRASEIAPAMGLIGTLVGLVQMLAQLSEPSTIGPPMAVALLTTFYGALLGTVILSPLAAKLERNASDEAQQKSLVLIGVTSITRLENPRRLEMLLNSAMPPSQRVEYFDNRDSLYGE